MTTEPIDLSADLTQEVEDEEIEEVDEPIRRPARTTRRVAEVPTGNPGITFALVVSTILIALCLALSLKSGSNEVWQQETLNKDGMFSKLSNFFYDLGSAKKTVNDAITTGSKSINDAHKGIGSSGGDDE